MPEKRINPKNKSLAIGCQTGIDLLHNPALNKGSALTEEERDALGVQFLAEWR